MQPLEPCAADTLGETGDLPHLLVLDDDHHVRALLGRKLELAGYRVSAASSPAQAIDLLQKSLFQAVILDVRMSGPMSGLDVLAEVRRHPDMVHTPALVMTSGTLDDHEQLTVMKHRAFLFYKLEGIDTILDFLSQLTSGHRSAG
jgi:CheY-like chemotaxis protein